MIPVPLDEQTSNNKGKYTNKFGSATGGNHTIILSMKGKRAHDIDGHTVDEICKILNRSPDGVTLVDSQTVEYGEQVMDGTRPVSVYYNLGLVQSWITIPSNNTDCKILYAQNLNNHIWGYKYD